MNDICKCCNSEITMNFCGNCGQKKARRIDALYLKEELQYTLLHTNKGFFYSVKKIAKAPGTTAREFIEGNRVNHYKPMLMAFVLAGITAFLVNTFTNPVAIYSEYLRVKGEKNIDMMIGAMSFVMKYNSFIMLLNIPLIALFSWIAFKKYGYNYYENVIANAFLLSAVLIFSIAVVFPLQFLFRHNPELYMIIPTTLSYTGIFLISIWFFKQLYPEQNLGVVILRLMGMYVLLFATMLTLMVIGTTLYFI